MYLTQFHTHWKKSRRISRLGGRRNFFQRWKMWTFLQQENSAGFLPKDSLTSAQCKLHKYNVNISTRKGVLVFMIKLQKRFCVREDGSQSTGQRGAHLLGLSSNIELPVVVCSQVITSNRAARYLGKSPALRNAWNPQLEIKCDPY